MSHVTFEIIDNIRSFKSLEETYNAVYQQCKADNPMLTHPWLLSWLEAYGKDSQINVMVFKDGETIIGFAPLVIARTRIAGIQVKALKFISDHWGQMDFLICERVDECLNALLNWFVDRKPADVFILSRMPKQGVNTKLLEHHIAAVNLKCETRDLKNVVLYPETSWTGFLEKRSNKFRYQLKDKTKKISKRGKISFNRMVQLSEKKDIIEMMQEINRESWKKDNNIGVATNDDGQVFYNRLFGQWGKTDQLDVTFLNLDDQPIAYALRIHFMNKYYALETAYKKDYYEFSPGMLVHGYFLEELYKEKSFTAYELGEADEYKQRWSDEFKEEVKMIVYNKTLKAGLVKTIKKIKKP